jgi:anti-anti-sigma factor
MQIRATPHSGAMLLEVAEPRIDAVVAIRFKEHVRDAAGPGPGPVILDLSAVRFIDSSGLGALVAAMKLLGPERPLILCQPSEPVAKVLRLTRMESVFTIHSSPQDALAGLPGAA